MTELVIYIIFGMIILWAIQTALWMSKLPENAKIMLFILCVLVVFIVIVERTGIISSF